jgi:hypothetical protein
VFDIEAFLFKGVDDGFAVREFYEDDHEVEDDSVVGVVLDVGAGFEKVVPGGGFDDFFEVFEKLLCPVGGG